MFLNKINYYLLNQISKNFILILFIFLSVAWLLQITRLFTITNFMQVEIINIIILSFYLIPNIITVIAPFILIFGLMLCFVRLNRENELIAILSLGLGLNPFKKTLILFGLMLTVLFTSFNFFLSPIIYKKYKLEEYDLRNTIDFNSMTFSNFLNLNKTTILDFTKINNEYQDVFISFKDDKDNIVYAKKGEIYNDNEFYKFKLINGFKISIDKDKQIEKLEFLNYILKIENRNLNSEIILDKNTFTIFDDIKSKNYLNISFKIMDIFLIIYIIFLFYNNNIRKINFSTANNIFFSCISISILLINQILKNSEIILFNYFFLIIFLISLSLLISVLKIKYEKN